MHFAVVTPFQGHRPAFLLSSRLAAGLWPVNKPAALSYSVSSGMEEQGSYKVTAHAKAHDSYIKEMEHLLMRFQSIGWKVLSLFWESLNIEQLGCSALLAQL